MVFQLPHNGYMEQFTAFVNRHQIQSFNPKHGYKRVIDFGNRQSKVHPLPVTITVREMGEDGHTLVEAIQSGKWFKRPDDTEWIRYNAKKDRFEWPGEVDSAVSLDLYQCELTATDYILCDDPEEEDDG